MSDQNILIPSSQNNLVLPLTRNLIVKINEINQLNQYKYALFNGLYTTEYLDGVDSLVLQELAIAHGLTINLPNEKIDGSWAFFDYKWGRMYVISNVKMN